MLRSAVTEAGELRAGRVVRTRRLYMVAQHTPAPTAGGNINGKRRMTPMNEKHGYARAREFIGLRTGFAAVAGGEYVQETIRNKSADELPLHSPTLDGILCRLSEVWCTVRRLVTAVDRGDQDFIQTFLLPCFRRHVHTPRNAHVLLTQ